MKPISSSQRVWYEVFRSRSDVSGEPSPLTSCLRVVG